MCLGIPGQVVEIVDRAENRALVDVEGVRREISVALLGGGPQDTGHQPVRVGDWVLIHVGFALARIDEEEAARTLEILRDLGAAYADELAQFRASRAGAGGSP